MEGLISILVVSSRCQLARFSVTDGRGWLRGHTHTHTHAQGLARINLSTGNTHTADVFA